LACWVLSSGEDQKKSSDAFMKYFWSMVRDKALIHEKKGCLPQAFFLGANTLET